MEEPKKGQPEVLEENAREQEEPAEDITEVAEIDESKQVSEITEEEAGSGEK